MLGSERKSYHYSNDELPFIPFQKLAVSHSPTFWQGIKNKGMLAYNISGVGIVSMEGGFFNDITDPFRKQEFLTISGKYENLIVMIYGGLFPACETSEYSYNISKLTDNWMSYFNLKVKYLLISSRQIL